MNWKQYTFLRHFSIVYFYSIQVMCALTFHICGMSSVFHNNDLQLKLCVLAHTKCDFPVSVACRQEVLPFIGIIEDLFFSVVSP